MEQKQMNWYGPRGLASPYPMTAREFTARLRLTRTRVAMLSDSKIVVATGRNDSETYTGKRG